MSVLITINTKNDVLKSPGEIIESFSPDELKAIQKQLPESESLLFSAIDPYGETIFNYNQIKELNSEIENLSVLPNINKDLLATIKHSVDRAIKSPNTYLVFVGD